MRLDTDTSDYANNEASSCPSQLQGLSFSSAASETAVYDCRRSSIASAPSQSRVSS